MVQMWRLIKYWSRYIWLLLYRCIYRWRSVIIYSMFGGSGYCSDFDIIFSSSASRWRTTFIFFWWFSWVNVYLGFFLRMLLCHQPISLNLLGHPIYFGINFFIYFGKNSGPVRVRQAVLSLCKKTFKTCKKGSSIVILELSWLQQWGPNFGRL